MTDVLTFPMARLETQYIDAVDVAKLLRTRLKQEFPGVKFGVTTDKYRGGASIRVKWTDGPKRAAAEAIIHQYEGADFDGMIDLKTYKVMDEAVRAHHPEIPDLPLKGMADFIFAERELSPGLRLKVAQAIAAKWGFEVPADQNAWWSFHVPQFGEHLDTLIHQAVSRPERFLLTEEEVV